MAAAISETVLSTPVGRLRLRVGPRGVLSLNWLRADDQRPASLPDRGADDVGAIADQLAEYFAGGRTDFSVALDWGTLSGSRLAVLQSLQSSVGYGRTVTYGGLAELSGTGVPARGIGALMGSNPFPILVPCHRVLASDGLGGYSGGDPSGGYQHRLEVKRWLLMLEEGIPRTLDWPAGL
jgi:methylated-DNA-[protein]-cysteine S-methyltransferase